jgi:hypothetical protein
VFDPLLDPMPRPHGVRLDPIAVLLDLVLLDPDPMPPFLTRFL